MLKPNQKIAVHFDDTLGTLYGKMGNGVLRYTDNPVACVIDSKHAGKKLHEVINYGQDCPVVATVEEAIALGTEVIILGMAPAGGQLSPHLVADLDTAIACGLCLVNGLHEFLATRYKSLRDGQWVWDIRMEPSGLPIASAQAALLDNQRVLMVGTDMAIGKMTVGLELLKAAKAQSRDCAFLATGQIGIIISGNGIPLDAIRVDFAAGAVENLVMQEKDRDLLIIEGQGSLTHPGSTSTIPLMRGACPTHLVMCHKAGKDYLHSGQRFPVPPVADLCTLYEDVAAMHGLYPRPKTIAIAIDTSELDESQARQFIDATQQETCIYTTDVIRYGAASIADLLECGRYR